MAEQEQAEKIIEIPGRGEVAFPASMTDAQINAAATKLYQEANPGKKQPPVTSWVDTAVDWTVDKLPAIGMTVGGIAGTSAGPAGTVAGAALGGAGGEAWKQNINRMRGREAPATPGEAASLIGQEGAKDALYGAVGVGVGGVAGVAAPSVGRAAQASGAALERAADSTAVHYGSKVLAGWLGLGRGAFKEAVAAYAIPPLMRGTGRAVAAGGRAISAAGERAAAPSAAEVVKARLARIPIEGRLAGIDPIGAAAKPTAKAAEAVLADSIAADVDLIRASMSKGMAEGTAIKIAAEGSKEYADLLKKAWIESVKKSGGPIPESAATRLMQSKSFAGLPSTEEAAATIAARNAARVAKP